MSDIPVFQRRGYSDAVQTTLTADILSSAVALTVADGASYPAANFFIVIDAGSETSEDVVFVGTRTGNTFGDLRGLDFDHVSGATVAHAFTTQDADEANASPARSGPKATSPPGATPTDGNASRSARTACRSSPRVPPRSGSPTPRSARARSPPSPSRAPCSSPAPAV
jgi:hypothetical protein